MKKKIVGIFICTLMIVISVLPATGTINENKNQDLNTAESLNDDCDCNKVNINSEAGSQSINQVQSTSSAGCGILYAGTSDPGVVYKYENGIWTCISTELGYAVLDIIYFEGNLYAATMSDNITCPPPVDGVGRVWRYQGGTNWFQVPDNFFDLPGLGDDDDMVCDLEIFNGDLYAGTAYIRENADIYGGRLYRYDAGTFVFVDYMSHYNCQQGPGHRWGGIRSMYPSSRSGQSFLYLGDWWMDSIGHYDGTTMVYDFNRYGGSCIWDFAEFNNTLYAGAYTDTVYFSRNGITWDFIDFSSDLNNIWELEIFQNYLYMGDAFGQLRRIDANHNHNIIWTTPSTVQYKQQICAMAACGNSILYLGTGREEGSGYYPDCEGIIGDTARIYAYDGFNLPVEIFDADGGGTSDDHTGIQCLYLKPDPLNFTKDDGIADDECVLRGDIITYDIYFENPYPFTLTDVTVVDTLPDEVWFYQASSPPYWEYDPGPPVKIKWEWGNIPPETAWHCFVQVKVKQSCPAATILRNIANITSNKTGEIIAYEYTKVCKNQTDNDPPYEPGITGMLPIPWPIHVEIPVKIIPKDPDGDRMYLWIDWGDGSNTGWIGPYPSDEETIVNHTWNKTGIYLIKAKAEDVYGAEGPWGYHLVITPRTHTYNPLILRLLDMFPNAFPILRHILGLYQ